MGTNNSAQFVFADLPQNADELLTLPEASLDTPHKTVALALLALLQYEANPEACHAMLDALRGPDPMSPYTKSFIRDRLRGKIYKVRSFFAGATPENNYTPTEPYTITVSENPYSYPEENWATLYVQSGGADSPRPVKLRRKPSENKWYLNDLQCLSDIRMPVSADPWAWRQIQSTSPKHRHSLRGKHVKRRDTAMKKIQLVDEYNINGHLIYFDKPVGAYIRGKTLPEALQKLSDEAISYCRWAQLSPSGEEFEYEIIQEKHSNLQVCDADSDVLFESEKRPLSMEEYTELKNLTLKSAKDFLTLYQSVPDKDGTTLPKRKTFYGDVPTTAREMYTHTKNVNEYYFGEIGVEASNEPDIYLCRLQGFETLEGDPDFLKNTVFQGSYGEEWSLRKLCRRFIWHDRIHAKAMWRMSVKLCPDAAIENPFCFV